MKRMKTIATALLLLAMAGSVIAWPYRQHFWGGLVFAAFEAAMVGALADWFAVVALFRHPLGLKFIPHTAIISSNRGRIIDTITDIVENQWFNLESLKNKIFDYPIVDRISSYLVSTAGHSRLEELITSLLANTVRDISPENAARFLSRILREHVDEIKVSPELVQSIETKLKSLYGDDLIDFFLDWAISATTGDGFSKIIEDILQGAVEEYSRKGGFWRRVGKGLGEGLDLINYQDAAQSVSAKTRQFLARIKNPHNSYRQSMKATMDKIRLADPETASAVINGFIRKGINTEAGTKTVAEILTALRQQLVSGEMEPSPLIKYLTEIVIEQIDAFKTDHEKRDRLESWIKEELITLVERYHGVFGTIVRENLQALNDEGFVESLEDKVGDDLQWIRVNGTVIGSLVGIAEYLIMHLIGKLG
jgi:uncharacterized membrane-anchored protein YjiN (DUF445 family)